MNPVQQPEPILVSVNNAAAMLGISRPTIYKLLKSGALRAVKSGGRTLIPTQALKEYAAGLPPFEPVAEGMREPEVKDAERPIPDVATSALVNMEDAARFLGCGRTTLYSLIASGRVLAVKQGRRTLIRRRSLEAYVANLANVPCA